MKQFLKFVFASMVGFFLANVMIFFASIFFIGALIGLSRSQEVAEKIELEASDSQVLRLDLSGQIIERDRYRDFDFGSIDLFNEDRPLGLFDAVQTLKKAAKDDKVKGLYITYGPLQAGWASLSSLRRALVDFKASGKFIYSYATGFNESTYYIASLSDVIFMYPEGSFELNGFAAVPTFMKGFLEKLKVQPRLYRAGAYKSAAESFFREDMSPENREQVHRFIVDFWQTFSDTVTKERKLEANTFQGWTENLLITNASQAQENKLIDELKYEDEVLEFLRGAIGIEDEEDIPFVAVQDYTRLKEIKNPGMQIRFGDQKDPHEGHDQVAVIFAEGQIVSGSAGEGYIGSEDIMGALREARKDEDVKAVVLRVNSPGGSALASDEIWREMSITDREKPVVASFGDLAASGGYYISMGARRVLAEPNTLTGSIGVFGLFMLIQEGMKEHLGITFDRVVSHPFADMMYAHREVEEREKEVIESEIRRVYSRFLDVVRTGRKMEEGQVVNLAEGRVWSGQTALTHSLVDEMGGLQQAIEWAAKEAQVEDYKIRILPQRNPFKNFMNFISGSIQRGLSFLGFFELKKWLFENQGPFVLWPYEFEVR